jgi:Spy/CpxP family protein refolding chaperone
MKTLLKLSLLSLGLASVLPTLNAADAADGAAHERHPRMRMMMKRRAMLRAHAARKLDLSVDQRAQIKANGAKVREQLKTLRADNSLTKEQKRDKARELLQSARNQFRGVLTPEQQAKIDQFRANRQAKRQGAK